MIQLKNLIIEDYKSDKKYRDRIRFAYKKIKNYICEGNINVDMAWRNVTHLYGDLLGDSSKMQSDDDTIEKYGVHDVPALAKIDLSKLFPDSFLKNYTLKITVGEMYHGGVHMKNDYISISVSDDQSEIMFKFFNETPEEKWNKKSEFKKIISEYICEKLPKYKVIFFHELVHTFDEHRSGELPKMSSGKRFENPLEINALFQEIIFKIEDEYDGETLKNNFENFQDFKNWVFYDKVENDEFGVRLDFDKLRKKDRKRLIKRLYGFWKNLI